MLGQSGLVKELFQDISTEWDYSLNRKNTLSDGLLSFNVLCNCLYFIVIIFCAVCKESENKAIILNSSVNVVSVSLPLIMF